MTLTSLETNPQRRRPRRWRRPPEAAVATVDGVILAKALSLLLGEASLVVVGADGGAAGDVALGLTELLKPLRWRGALVMALPRDDAESLLGAPIPIVAGCSERTFASLEDVDVHVLRLGEKCTLSGTTPEPPQNLVAAFDGVSCAAPPHVGWVCDASLVAPARRLPPRDTINELVGDLATDHEVAVSSTGTRAIFCRAGLDPRAARGGAGRGAEVGAHADAVLVRGGEKGCFIVGVSKFSVGYGIVIR